MLKLVVVAIMLLTSIVSANEAFEFQGFDAWYLQQKDWVKTDNTLSWPHVSWAEARLGEFQWTDYDLTFTVVPEEYGKDGEVRLYFRQTKPFHTYGLHIREDVIFVSRFDSTVENYRILEQADGVGVKQGEEAKIRLVCKESDFYVYLNDELILEIYSIKYKSGGIAFWAENTKFTVKDFSITGVRDETKVSTDMGFFPQNDPRSGGVNHMMLIYNNSGYNWMMIDALPYVSYIAPLMGNYELKVEDYFFDTFLFLALTAPDGHAFDSPSRGTPAKKEQWQWFIDKIFHENNQLSAFEKAYEFTNDALGGDVKGKIFIMIPNPMVEIKDFGDVDGTGSLNFSWKDAEKAKEHRLKAVKWYIDEVLARWEAANYQNLELLGFYWVEEWIHYSNPGELELIQMTSDYIHELGYKHTWIPYFTSSGHNRWEEAGFDFIMHQPNHMFRADSTIDRFVHTTNHALKYGQGLEIEAEGNSVTRDPVKRKKFLDYLRAGVTLNWQKEAVHGYYQGVNYFGSCAISDDPKAREIYDLVYQYVKGIFDEPLGTK